MAEEGGAYENKVVGGDRPAVPRYEGQPDAVYKVSIFDKKAAFPIESGESTNV